MKGIIARKRLLDSKEELDKFRKLKEIGKNLPEGS